MWYRCWLTSTLSHCLPVGCCCRCYAGPWPPLTAGDVRRGEWTDSLMIHWRFTLCTGLYSLQTVEWLETLRMPRDCNLLPLHFAASYTTGCTSSVTSHRQPWQCRGPRGPKNGKGGPKWPELCIKTVIRLCTGISQNHHPCQVTLPFRTGHTHTHTPV